MQRIDDLDPRMLLTILQRQYLRAFIAGIFPVVSPGDKFMDNWHIHAICEALERCARGETRRLIINVPPRHMKSICVAIGFVAWLLGHDPTRRIIVASYSNDLAIKLGRDCRAVMESDIFKRVFPNVRLARNPDTQTEFMTRQGGTRLSTSVGGTVTGKGGHFLIIDDPIKPEEALSEPRRQGVNDWNDMTFRTRLDDQETGCIILVMQRLHEDDLTGHLLDQGGWEHLNLRSIALEHEQYQIRQVKGSPLVVARKPGDLLDPHRFNQKILDELKASLGQYAFAAQYQQSPAPVGGGMIKLDWFKRYDALPEGQPGRVIQSWDTASKIDEANDYSVCTTWAEYGNRFYLTHVLRQRLEFPQLRRLIEAHAASFNAKAVLIEDKGSGIQLIQDMKQNTRLPIIGVQPQGDKQTRMMGETPKIESGLVYIPLKAPWLADFQHEVAMFPKGKHDDQIDSMSQALEYLTRREVILRIR